MRLSLPSSSLIASLLLLGSAGPGMLRAQQIADPAAEWTFQRFDQHDGLSQNTVSTIVQDRQGFLWIGTADGLNRYDGYGFTVFRLDPADPHSVSDNTIQALLVDSAGAIWVGSAAGLDRLDVQTGVFDRLAPPGFDVAALALDPAGRVWAESFRFGLHRVEPGADTLVPMHSASALRPSHPLLTTGADGALWVVEVSPDRVTTLRRIGAESDVPAMGMRLPAGTTALHAGRSGTVWISASAAELPAPFRRLPVLPAGEFTRQLLEDHDGRLWIGSDRGVYLYDPATESLALHPLDPGAGASLSNYVLDLYEDRAGAVWIGTRSGLYRWDPHRKPFRHLSTQDGPPAPVMAIQETGEDLWAGTLGSGLLRYRPAEGRAGFRPDAGTLPSDHVWALLTHPAAPHRLWIGTDDGLATLDRRTGRIRAHPLPPDALGNRHVYALTDDRRGGLWVGGSLLLHHLDAATGRLLGHVDLNAIPKGSTVQALHVDRAGTLWIGTEKRGLWTYRDGRLADAETPALAGATVWCIHEDGRGVLWLGTTRGLFRLDPATGQRQPFDGGADLPGALIYSILEDDAGRLWLGTSHGLACFDPATGRFRAYDLADGVINLEFDRRAAFHGADGTFYFGGLDGVTAFRPEAVHDNPVVPPVVLLGVRRTRREGTDTLDPAAAGQAGLALSHRDHTLVFEFVALGFTSPQRNRYAYRLEGFDADWVDAGTERQARYTNVPPGTYTFRVKAANNDGLWNEQGAALRLTIAPPYWQTGWFRLMALAAVVGVLAAAYRYRVNRLLEVERMRLRIAADLHDDIGSKLASVALMSEMVARRVPLDARERHRLDEITHVTRRMASDLRDIVWLVRPDHDTLGDLVSKLEHVAASLLDGVSCAFHFEDGGADQILDMEQRRQLFLIYREVLHNVARHARATHADIRFERTGDTLSLRIRDDGVGFEPTGPHAGNGLHTLRERARRLGGALTIESAPGAGTTVELSFRIA